ncbi:CHAT domain-containing protein [Pleurocapsa sp. FMAR1]|uniref:CHAT domain-containing protein n=1 Tax=Pleurocapsa sp. FMAR1 TaxID=3040204 RepID=UPI0029C95251|nr:CHAT domain-containing protein [Pleurocapsa sp. FMAR1]
MSSKLRQRYLLLFVFAIVGLSTSLVFDLYQIPAVLATTYEQTVVTSKSAEKLEAEGKYFYSLSQFAHALKLWHQAELIYADSEDSLSQARILSNLALAYSQLNNWQQSTAKITASLQLLNQKPEINSPEHIRALAQVFNNQGIIQLSQGKVEQAIATWSQAKVNYEESGNDLGVIRASINQASAFKQLGLYYRAVKTLAEVKKRLAQEPDSLLKATGLRSYGDILRLVGQNNQSKQILERSLAIAAKINAPEEEVKTLLALGNSYQPESQKALKKYQQGLEICRQQPNCLRTDLPLQIYLAQINLLSKTRSWQRSQELIPTIQAEFNQLPNSRTNINQKINFAYNLVELRHISSSKAITNKVPTFSAIEQFLVNTLQQAKALDYIKAQSYILGLQGQIEEDRDWQNAQKYTQQALVLAQDLNAPEIIYLWQWQLGRINRALGNRSQAIAYYSQAVEMLQSLSQDLVAINPDIQYSFSSSVEPVYRELVSLLLEAEPGKEVSQANLEGGRKVIESLQLAELNNFFREACLDAQAVNIESIDAQAAVIYPIILSDRLEVILSLPHKPLKHYQADISQVELEKIIAQLRHNIVVRSRRNFYSPASKLYDLLIRPALEDLANSQIKTLVFVPDGAFRSIPLGALYDGQKFLIEDYSIALTPGLQLLAPHPLEQVKLKTIIAGLTKSRQGFSALNYVESELKEIGNMVDGVTLLNQNFTAKALQQEIKFTDYPIVHIATHGQFSSTLEDTFLLTWNKRININELDSILQTRNPSQDNAIELLVLSACETASGDKRAALGLAGMAVRAGARSTLATLWSVNDRATSKLMSEFYHELADKKLPKADAVRQAQLSLLHSSWYKHPFYWAPYVLLGNWL